MKLYRIGSPGNTPAEMKLSSEDGTLLENITVGESGRGRSKGIIPIVGEGSGVRAKRSNGNVVLVRGEFDDEERCLIVINSVGGYDKSRSYEIFDATGIETLVSGTHAFGDAGRVNGGEEVLAIATPGATFRLNSKYASHWYAWDGKVWALETPEVRKARLALEEVEKGGGEWL
jgi:hypothetical protein